MPSDAAPLKIGDLARLAGVSVDAVRFYEREGLLGTVRRTPAGQRMMVGRLAFVKRATALGFPLAEVRELVALRITAKAPCKGVRTRATVRLQDIDRRIAELQSMRAALAALAARAAERRRPAPAGFSTSSQDPSMRCRRPRGCGTDSTCG